jgi:hypothetical protein
MANPRAGAEAVAMHPSRAIVGRAVALLLVLGTVAACSDAGGPTIPFIGGADTPAPTSAANTAPTTAPRSSPSVTSSPPQATAPAATKRPTATTAPARPTPSPTHASTTATTGRIYVRDGGFEITMPKGWRKIDLAGDLLKQFAAGLPKDSQFAKLMAGQAGTMIANGVKLLAMDLRATSVADGYAANVSVLTLPRTDNMSIDAHRALLEAQLESVKEASAVSSKVVTEPAGKTIRMSYRMRIAMADGHVTSFSGTEFIVLTPSRIYAITFGCDVGSSACVKAADAAMRTFRVVS